MGGLVQKCGGGDVAQYQGRGYISDLRTKFCEGTRRRPTSLTLPQVDQRRQGSQGGASLLFDSIERLIYWYHFL